MVMTRIVYDVKYQAGLAREAGSRVPGSYLRPWVSEPFEVSSVRVIVRGRTREAV